MSNILTYKIDYFDPDDEVNRVTRGFVVAESCVNAMTKLVAQWDEGCIYSVELKYITDDSDIIQIPEDIDDETFDKIRKYNEW